MAVGAAVVSVGLGVFLPDHLFAVVLIGVGLTAFAAVGLERVKRWAGTALRPFLHPRVGGVAVVAAALAWGGYEGMRYDQDVETESDRAWADLADWASPKTAPAPVLATTDDGTTVLLHEPVDPWSADESERRDRTAVAVREYSDKWIRRGPATDASNCHGWVFTGGRYNVGGQQVPVILRENDYEEVSAPEAGDLCIYRDANDAVSHSAVVRAVLADGTVLVEGKWGRLGVYLHGVADSCYGDHFAYYRSSRDGHVLNGVEQHPGDQ